MAINGIDGGGRSASSGASTDSRAAAEREAAAERAAAAQREAAASRAAQAQLSVESARTLGAVAGRSAFEPARVEGPAAQRAAAQVTASNTILPAVRAISSGAQRVEAANAAVASLEETLAKDLAHLAPALSSDQLGAYAERYRTEPGHAEAYAEARDAANDLAVTLRDELPEAAAATATGGPEVDAAGSWLQESVSRAHEALAVSVRQSPTANTELARTLEEAQQRLSVSLSDGLGWTETALTAYGDSGRAFADIAAKAGQAFGVLNEGLGVVGTALDTAATIDRIREGEGRAEHYVGAAAGIAEVGIGVLSIAGVTVAAPITATVAVVAGTASAVSDFRDFQAGQQAVHERLRALGYDEATATGLSHGSAPSFEALRELGLDPGQLQRAVAASPRLSTMHPSVVASLGTAAGHLGLGAEDTVRFLEAMGPDADDAAGTLAMTQAQMDPRSRLEVLEALRPANPAFATPAGLRAADWLEAN